MDWIKHAKAQADIYEAQRLQTKNKTLAREAERREAETSWQQRIFERAREIRRQGMRLRITERKGGILEISQEGRVQIEFVGPGRFALKFFDVVAPTSLILRQTLSVHHHRVITVAELNAHNIEEIMKYAGLGQEGYHRIAEQARLERNLDEVLESAKVEERIAS